MRHIKKQPAVEAVFGIARSTVWHHVKHGLLPKPIKIGPRAVGWISDELEAVMNARIQGKGNAEIKALIIDLEQRRSQVAADKSSAENQK